MTSVADTSRRRAGTVRRNVHPMADSARPTSQVGNRSIPDSPFPIPVSRGDT